MTRRVSVRANLLAIASMLALLVPAGLAAPAAVLAADPTSSAPVDFDDSTNGTWTQSGSPTLTYVDDGAGGQALSILRRPGLRRASSRRLVCSSTTSCTRSRCVPGCPRARPPDRRPARRQARLHVGRQRHDRRHRLDDHQRHVHPARRGRSRGQPGLRQHNLAAPYTILVDDILITAPAAPPTADIITSVDFDDSTNGTWTQSGSPTLTYVDDGAGGMALSILRAQDYEGIQSPTGLLEHDVVYTFSMRARLPEGTAGSTNVRFVVKPQFTGSATPPSTAPAGPRSAALHAARRGRPVGRPDLHRQRQPGRPYTILVDDILVTAPAARRRR